MKKLLLILVLSFFFISCENKTKKVSENIITERQKREAKKTIDSNEISENYIMSFCNFAKIVDKDGYVNVREKGNVSSNVIGKIKSGDVVYIFEDLQTEWLNVDFKDENNRKFNGYIHRSRIKYINTLENIPSVIDDENGVNFILRDIVVEIKTDKFNYEQNKKYFSEMQREDFVVQKYKGKKMWGTDGTVPKTYYKSITITIGKTTTKILEKEIDDLFNPNNNYAECYFDKIDNSLYLHLSNSDGAGSYVALLEIKNGEYLGRQVEIPF